MECLIYLVLLGEGPLVIDHVNVALLERDYLNDLCDSHRGERNSSVLQLVKSLEG